MVRLNRSLLVAAALLIFCSCNRENQVVDRRIPNVHLPVRTLGEPPVFHEIQQQEVGKGYFLSFSRHDGRMFAIGHIFNTETISHAGRSDYQTGDKYYLHQKYLGTDGSVDEVIECLVVDTDYVNDNSYGGAGYSLITRSCRVIY